MNKKYIAHSDDIDFEVQVKNLLLYRKIIKVEKLDDQNGILTLDNSTQLVVQGNVGCGGCGNGWYYLDELNGCDNAITNVECSNLNEAIYNIFIYAEDKRINCVQYSGDDNGYYGTGYYLYVKIPNSDGDSKNE